MSKNTLTRPSACNGCKSLLTYKASCPKYSYFTRQTLSFFTIVSRDKTKITFVKTDTVNVRISIRPGKNLSQIGLMLLMMCMANCECDFEM